MDLDRAIPLPLANLLRVIHIALWMTIPTAVWLWLRRAPEPTPRACEPYCGWYQGNVLGVSEDSHVFILFCLLLLGFVVFACWIAGYWWKIVRRVLDGEKKLPPLRLSEIRAGFRLICSGLRYWSPVITYVIIIYVILLHFPREFTNRAFDKFMLAAVPVMLVMFLGYLAGLARYAASGERSLLFRRLENMRLALTRIKATSALILLLVVVTKLGAAAWAELSGLLYSMQDLDLLVEAALGSFGFFVVLLCGCFAYSYLFAWYTIKIGVRDYLKCSAKLG